jgi:hypothetical protein
VKVLENVPALLVFKVQREIQVAPPFVLYLTVTAAGYIALPPTVFKVPDRSIPKKENDTTTETTTQIASWHAFNML